MKVGVVVLAAGRGERLELGENKAFALLGGQTILARSARAFEEVEAVQEGILVVRQEEEERALACIASHRLIWRSVPGGPTRRDSALAGVRAVQADIVLIHDGARPFPSPHLIRRVIEAAVRTGAAAPVVLESELLHRRMNDRLGMLETNLSENERLVRAQTPQGFRRDLILRCLKASGSDVRDDATAVLRAGHPVEAVRGDAGNIKITVPEDLALAERLASAHC